MSISPVTWELNEKLGSLVFSGVGASRALSATGTESRGGSEAWAAREERAPRTTGQSDGTAPARAAQPTNQTARLRRAPRTAGQSDGTAPGCVWDWSPRETIRTGTGSAVHGAVIGRAGGRGCDWVERRAGAQCAGLWLAGPEGGVVIGRAGVMAAAAMVVAVPAGGGDFSDLREIKKQLLNVAERSRERGLQHSGKWWAGPGTAGRAPARRTPA